MDAFSRSSVLAMALLFLGGGSVGAFNNDHLVPGTKLQIRTRSAGNMVRLLAKCTPNTFCFVYPPGQGSSGPTCGIGHGGATLRVKGQGGDTVINLPCSNWSFHDKPNTTLRYHDPTQATCSSIVIAFYRMTAVCRGPQVAYAL